MRLLKCITSPFVQFWGAGPKPSDIPCNQNGLPEEAALRALSSAEQALRKVPKFKASEGAKLLLPLSVFMGHSISHISVARVFIFLKVEASNWYCNPFPKCPNIEHPPRNSG